MTHFNGFLAAVLAVSASCALASEGDLLIDAGVVAGSRTYTAYENPNLGGMVSILKGFNDQTDIGLIVSVDHANGLLDGPDQVWTTVGLQSWFTAFGGDIRPQIGGSVGVAMDGDSNAMFHLAGRMRGVIELSTAFRLFAGAAVGADIGDYGSISTKGEFGAQFLIR